MEDEEHLEALARTVVQSVGGEGERGGERQEEGEGEGVVLAGADVGGRGVEEMEGVVAGVEAGLGDVVGELGAVAGAGAVGASVAEGGVVGGELGAAVTLYPEIASMDPLAAWREKERSRKHDEKELRRARQEQRAVLAEFRTNSMNSPSTNAQIDLWQTQLSDRERRDGDSDGHTSEARERERATETKERESYLVRALSVSHTERRESEREMRKQTMKESERETRRETKRESARERERERERETRDHTDPDPPHAMTPLFPKSSPSAAPSQVEILKSQLAI